MKIGVICEGRTDFVAIEAFFGHALNEIGIKPVFDPIQPKMDNTTPRGGWARVLRWLERNDLQKRRVNYFDGGPFDQEPALGVLDCLLVQMDADVLDDIAFQKYVHDRYAGIKLDSPVPFEPKARAKEIEKVFLAAGWHLPNMKAIELMRHISSPAVESTEAWCLAAHSEEGEDFELISGQNLKDRFMSALALCEGKSPQVPYEEIDKNVDRRKSFCEEYAHCSRKVILGCVQFELALEKIKNCHREA